jgi:hypothetical protein
MAMTQGAFQAEKALGHDDNATTLQDVTNPGLYPGAAGEGTMKALAWMGKNKVEMIETARPKIMEPRDVILKITGSTVCGSDLHLLHSTVVELAKGDILGHEFCGIVDEVGSEITSLKKG